LNLLAGFGKALGFWLLGVGANAFALGAGWHINPFAIPALIGLTVLCWIASELVQVNAYLRKMALCEEQ
jgi:hypothetical protein